MEQTDRPRQPRGIREGGQFAPDVHAESSVDLLDARWSLPAPVPRRGERGRWDIEHASKPQPVARGNGVMVTEIRISGEPSANTDVAARAAAYPKPDDLDDKLRAAAQRGEPVTVLKVSEGMFGGGFPQIMQGRVFEGRGGQLGFLTTGKRTQGILLKGALDVIDNNKPASVTELNRRWYEETGLPPTAPLTLDVLKSATKDDPIAVLYTHPGFGEGRTPGCVWYIDYYEEDEGQEPGTGVAGGYCWCPDDHGLTSEHGSIYAKDLLETGALVTGPLNVSFGDMHDLPSDRHGAYARLFAEEWR